MATAEVITPQSEREQFLAQRRLGVGGSDAASLFPEESQYGCTLRLYFDKTDTPPDYFRTAKEEKILARGVLFEDLVASYFMDETGLKVRKIGPRVSKDHPAMRVNMDRQVIGVTTEKLKAIWPETFKDFDGEAGPGYLECKTAREQVFRKLQKTGLSVDYILQVQHGLAVTGYRYGFFAVLEPGSGEFLCFPVLRQENLIAEVIFRAEEFWKRVGDKNPPAPLPKADRRCQNCLWRKTCPLASMIAAGIPKDDGEYQLDDSLTEIAADYRDALEILEEKQELVSTIKQRIQELLGDRQRVAVPSLGKRFRWTYSNGRQTWDSKALTAEVEKLEKTNAELAARIANCKKQGAPVRSFYFEDAV